VGCLFHHTQLAAAPDAVAAAVGAADDEKEAPVWTPVLGTSTVLWRQAIHLCLPC
jgi:hypothetical protein